MSRTSRTGNGTRLRLVPVLRKSRTAAATAFEEYGWDWTYHAFREWAGWSVEHEGEDDATLRSSADNPRKRVVLEAFRIAQPAER